MINRVVLVGRLTGDPELKDTNGATPVATFSLAVNNRTKNPDGTYTTSFFNCVVFSNAADNVSKYARKGSLVGIEGRLQQRRFVRRDQTKGSVVEIICDSVQFLESRSEGPAQAETPTFDDVKDDDVSSNIDALDLPNDDLPF